MNRIGNRARGAALFVVLVMLVVLTLFVVAGVNLSSVNLKIVGNMQTQQAMEAVANQALAEVMSSPDNFTSPINRNISEQGTVVAVAAPVCTSSSPDPDTEATTRLGLPPDEYTNWDVRATASDNLTGASVAIHQGVAVRLPQGSCP
jgi:Tfp pilus assembly protein PilX